MLRSFHHQHGVRSERGFTLLELIVAATILSILTLMALPLAQLTIKREKEKQLRQALWQMRDAIDRYKDAADPAASRSKSILRVIRPTSIRWSKASTCRARKSGFCVLSLRTP